MSSSEPGSAGATELSESPDLALRELQARIDLLQEAANERERLCSMAAELVIGEERLRHALAAELHQGLGQDIAMARMRLSMLRKSAGVELLAPLAWIEERMEQADRSLHAVACRIGPPSLHDLGLVAALRWLGEDIAAKHGIDVRIEDDGSPAVADERTRVVLFRAVRELLVDGAARARVRSVAVRLARQDEHVRIEVEDDGDAALERCHGLFALREHLKFVEGTLHVVPASDRGRAVILTAPSAPRPG